MQEYANPPQAVETTEDDFVGGKIRIRQPAQGFRAGGDAVLLAAAIAPRSGERVLDVGCGVGTVGLCLLARFGDCHVTGVDIQPEFVTLARENAALNKLADKTEFLVSNIKINSETIEENSFDQVMMNPPYFDGNTHPPSPHASRAAARSELGEGGATLEDWVNFAHRVLKNGRRLTMINRTERLDDILKCLRGKFGSVVIYPLWPRLGEPAKRVIVVARKGKRGPMRILPGLVIHKPHDNSYTPEAEAVMADTGGLDIKHDGE